MVTWKECQQRLSTTTSVSSILQNDQLSKNRYYISSIVDIVHFLCANKLPFRGNENEAFQDLYLGDDTQPCGLFMKLFQYTLEKDSKLMECYSTIQKNANYTSAAMQNEIIELLRRRTVSLMVNEIKCSDVPYFTLKCDGMHDFSNTEILAIVIRYLKNGRVLEKLVAMPTTQYYDAETLAHFDPKRMLSQCYDGASEMSGKIGSVQRKIQNRLEKYIPYVHCLNHQLHLVVVNTIKRISELATFFIILLNGQR
ncbi:uncharacterized protein LOC115214790 [Octopus sinensis]|uniref:Uncharacterized protein LOC115214790 n=1 Tax=Octopus sinensis TaxID=2607531 RepID=A0A6P7SP79_9MOLL|nr:uncharacterized protein LOC115214790 [Octopus sinensis]